MGKDNMKARKDAKCPADCTYSLTALLQKESLKWGTRTGEWIDTVTHMTNCVFLNIPLKI